jgi:hypothetical protein
MSLRFFFYLVNLGNITYGIRENLTALGPQTGPKMFA